MGEQNNALMIAQRYPEAQYNLLVPMKTVAEIAEVHKPVINAVQISTNLADAEIYEQEKAREGYRDNRTGRDVPPSPAKYALTKKGLNKLMRAAGIKILGTRPIVPSTCQKCAEVNRSIGRPVNCGACGNKDVKYEARISVPQLTGENIEFVAHKEIIVQDAIDGMTDRQRREFLKFRNEMCETKAINRALRAAMQIKGTYTLEELRKPFVVAYLVPNLDNPDVKAEAVKHFFTSAQEIYGGGATEQRRAVYVEDDTPEEYSYETTGRPVAEPGQGAQAYSQYPQEPPQPQPTRERQQAPQGRPPQGRGQAQAEAEAGMDFDPTVCCVCGKKVSNGVVKYSQEQFGRTLCMNCQRNQGGGQ